MKEINNNGFEKLVPYLEGLVAQSRDAFWVRGADYSGQLYISPAYEKIWGRSCESLYQDPSSWITFVFPEDRERLESEIEQRSMQAVAGRKFFQSYRIVCPDGGVRWIEDESFAIFDEDGNHIGFAGTASDITEQKEHEINLQKEKEREEAISKAKSEFIANMSHDIKTPLSGMIGMVNIMMAQLQDPGQLVCAQNILNASRELMKFIENCLEMVRLEDGEAIFNKENFNLNALADEVCALYRPAASSKGLSLTVEHEKNTSDFFLGNRGGIYRILLNLIGNAVKFTAAGSIRLKVAIRTELVRTQQPIVTFTVTDTGIGIPKDKQNVIFERYIRVAASNERHYEGSGIGLHVVKKIVERLQGEIYVVSEEGKGSSFIVLLPLSIPLLQPEEYCEINHKLISVQESSVLPVCPLPASFYPKNTTLSKELLVLLAEDNILAQQIAQYILGGLGCRVDIADNGKQALELYKKTNYDLAFVDVGLPDMSGYSLVKKLRKIDQEKARFLPIIMLTAHAVKDLRETPTSADVQEMISKPLTQEKACEIINTYIRVKQ